MGRPTFRKRAQFQRVVSCATLNLLKYVNFKLTNDSLLYSKEEKPPPSSRRKQGKAPADEATRSPQSHPQHLEQKYQHQKCASSRTRQVPVRKNEMYRINSGTAYNEQTDECTRRTRDEGTIDDQTTIGNTHESTARSTREPPAIDIMFISYITNNRLNKIFHESGQIKQRSVMNKKKRRLTSENIDIEFVLSLIIL